ALLPYSEWLCGPLSRPGGGPVACAGNDYGVTTVNLAPPLAAELIPGVFVSGSSAAGLDAARDLGALAVKYPKPVAEYEAAPPANVANLGIRVGIIARTESAEAWQVANARFPTDRKGEVTHQLAMKVSDSSWHRQLSELGKELGGGSGERDGDDPYWMVPSETYSTFCPSLVGS